MKIEPKLMPVVVAQELGKLFDGRDVVLGYIIVFNTHNARYDSLEAVAASLAPFPLQPVPIPEEEGWGRAIDLPDFMRKDLDAMLVKSRKEIASGGAWVPPVKPAKRIAPRYC